MDPREELAALRRLAELEAKAGVAGAPAAEAAPMSRMEAVTSPQGRDMLKRELLTSPPMAIARGVKDVIDTGAGFLSRLGGAEEQARVRAADAAGRAEFDQAAQGRVMPQVGRIAGNVAATAPAVSALGGAIATQFPRLGAAFSSGGMSTGAAPATTVAGRAGDMAIRTAGGAGAGFVGAGMVNPEGANTGAAIGAFLPGGVKVAGYLANKAGQAVRGSVKHGLGLATGVGAEPVAQAFRAGKAGNREFLENMRGEVPIDDILARAKQGLDTMRAAKSAQYRSGMIPVAGDKTALAFDDIQRAFDDAANVTGYKGQVKNEAAAGYVARMRQAVDEWRALDPAEFHTPEGMDALKQKLGAIMESIPPQERGAKLAAGKVYNATKATIEKQAPTYAKVMREYSQAADEIMQIERALSLGDKASIDTGMRKLQSLMRNNVQTNYGNRLSMASELESKGGVSLMPSLAGQAMSSWTPRSLAGQVGGGATALMALQNPAMLAALPMQSPRIVGNLLYGAGRAAGSTAQLGQAVGRVGSSAAPAIGARSADEAIAALYRFLPAATSSPEARR